jgi:hypothetical protein
MIRLAIALTPVFLAFATIGSLTISGHRWI